MPDRREKMARIPIAGEDLGERMSDTVPDIGTACLCPVCGEQIVRGCCNPKAAREADEAETEPEFP